jgi:hypothetical protein
MDEEIGFLLHTAFRLAELWLANLRRFDYLHFPLQVFSTTLYMVRGGLW